MTKIPAHILQAKLALFQRLFPTITVTQLSETQGEEHFILEINHSWICKIAKHPDTKLALEHQLLILLQPQLNTSIPAVHYYEPGCLIYRKIAGIELSAALYASWNTAQRLQLATEIAQFLQELHAVKITDPVLLAQLAYDKWPYPAEKLLNHAALIQDPELQPVFRLFLTAYLQLTPLHAPVLLHNDLTVKNIIIDPETGKLNGIIDFTDMTIYDPYLDLRVRWNNLPELCENIARQYSALTGIKLELPRIYIYYLATEFSRYLQQL